MSAPTVAVIGLGFGRAHIPASFVATRSGEPLPSIRPLAEELRVNRNTVAKAYRELEHEGVIELRHGVVERDAPPTSGRCARLLGEPRRLGELGQRPEGAAAELAFGRGRWARGTCRTCR